MTSLYLIWVSPLPLQRKLLQNLSIFVKPHLGILCTERKYVGNVDRIDLTNNSLPGYEKNLFFQPGNLLPTFSITGCNILLVGF
jgi:hypothetical protein